jgi:CBS domain containing-hemolysin-like protein
MEVSGVHLLLVINEEGHFQGIISSEDVWGEKPIKLIQERRVPRDQVWVRTIMVPYTEITAFDYATIKTVHVGHIVKTLSEHNQHYALAVSPSTTHPDMQTIRGIFTASQISKQLHTDIADAFGTAG